MPLRKEETEADVVECGVFLEYLNGTVERKREERQLSVMNAFRMLFPHELSNMVWEKLYKQKCFENTRFPEVEFLRKEYSITGSVDKIKTW